QSMLRQGREGERAGLPHRAATCPGDDRALAQHCVVGRPPDPEMVLSEGEARLLERPPRAKAIEPSRRYEARHGPADRILQKGPPLLQPALGLGPGKAQELAFAGGQVTRFERGHRRFMPEFVMMAPAM